MKPQLFYLLILLSFTCQGQVIINEAQSANASTHYDKFGNFDDWIELYNQGDTEINIAGLILKDAVDTWQIPGADTGIYLQPGEYFLLWADDEEEQGPFHTNFKLSASNGEFLGLFEADGSTVIDSITLPPMSDDKSYGRCQETGWQIFDLPSPLQDNDCPSGMELQKDQDIHVFPVLFQSEITVQLENLGEKAHLQVYNSSGKLILQKHLDKPETILNLEHVPNGIYILWIHSQKKGFYRKLIKAD